MQKRIIGFCPLVCHRVVYQAFFLLFCLVVCAPITASADNLKSFTISSIPWQNEAYLRSTYDPLLALLSRELGRTTKLVIPENYEKVGESLLHYGADIGILGGNAYVTLKDKFPEIHYIATCKQPTAYYQSLIITRKDSGISSLADLSGKSFGFTDIQSTSGYIYPKMMIEEEGYDVDSLFKKTYFLNKHDKIYDAVAKGSITSGGVSSTAFAKGVERNGDVYQVIKRSAPIPRNAIVGAPHLTEVELEKIREILSTAEHDSLFYENSSILKGFLIKNDAFYDSIRKIN